MELQPSEPPGHAKRKLRGYVSEIARLRAEGYTIRAVHQALIKAGVNVAWATVQREAARLGLQQSSVRPNQPAGTARLPGKTPAANKKTMSAEIDSHFESHTSNPLFKKKAAKS
jgi:hypothetical protein